MKKVEESDMYKMEESDDGDHGVDGRVRPWRPCRRWKSQTMDKVEE